MNEETDREKKYMIDEVLFLDNNFEGRFPPIYLWRQKKKGEKMTNKHIHLVVQGLLKA